MNTDETYRILSLRLKNFLRNNWNFQEEDVEEIIQDVLVILHRKNQESRFRWNISWLYKVAYNKAIDKIKYRKTVESLDGEYEIASPCLNPEEELMNSLEREWVKGFLNSLDRTNRNISYLYYYENFRCRSIGEILQIPAGTVKYRLSNIRKMLKAAYEKYEKN